MNPLLASTLTQYQQEINQHLAHSLSQRKVTDETLMAAMQHGLLQGGKRIRPFLVYCIGQLLGAEQSELNAAAVAIEAIHAYSLIHDDLPAMDDDDLRRGKPTCHIAFDEASAILAGDALQTLAFETLSDASKTKDISWRLKMINALAKASGDNGMCGGQSLDLAATGKQVSLTGLEQIHAHKTGKLIECAVELGILAAHVDDAAITQPLIKYAKAIGLAFQVQDDILDLTSDTKTLGKPQGSDTALNKSTYPALLGLEGAQKKAQQLIQDAVQALSNLPYTSNSKNNGLVTQKSQQQAMQLLSDFAHYIVERNK